MNSEDDLSPQRQSEIRSEVARILRIDPITLGMSTDQIRDSDQASEKRIEAQFPDSAERRYAKIIHKGYKLEQSTQQQRDSHENPSPEQVWLPTQHADVLSGFLPLEMLTEGGTSQIWLCKSRFAEEHLIVKLVTHKGDIVNLRPALALRELQMLFDRRHPNIVNVYDAGYVMTRDGEFPYVAMEQLVGTHLRKCVEEDSDGTDRSAAEAVSAIANGVQFCHANGISHRDLKPENIFVCTGKPIREAIKLIDFGFATNHADLPLGGTPGPYSDPAVRGAQHLSMMYSDIYAIGAILYFCVTHRDPPLIERPQECSQTLETALKNVADPVLRQIIFKAMRPDIHNRYQSPGAIEHDLDLWLNNSPIPHLGIAYPLKRKWNLLLDRCKKGNNVQDHSTLIALCLLFLSLLQVSCTLVHLMFLRLGFDEAFIYGIMSIIGNGAFVAVFLLCAYWVNWKWTSFRMLQSMLFMVVAHVVLFFLLVPATMWSLPAPAEISSATKFFMLILALSFVLIGSIDEKWRTFRTCGWVLMALMPLVRLITEMPGFSPYSPILVIWSEVLFAILFARPYLADFVKPVPSGDTVAKLGAFHSG